MMSSTLGACSRMLSEFRSDPDFFPGSPRPFNLILSLPCRSKGAESGHGHRRFRAAGRSPQEHQGSTCSSSVGFLLRNGLRLVVDYVDALGAFPRWCWPPVVWLAARVVCSRRYRFVCGPILICVHYEGHNRRKRGSRPPSAPDSAVAGGLWLVPVRLHWHPSDHGAQHDLPAGGLRFVSRACYC